MRLPEHHRPILAVLAAYVVVLHTALFGLQTGVHAQPGFDPAVILCTTADQPGGVPPAGAVKDCPCGAMCTHAGCGTGPSPAGSAAAVEWSNQQPLRNPQPFVRAIVVTQSGLAACRASRAPPVSV